MAVTMLSSQTVLLTATETDAAGDVLTPAGPLTWSADNTSDVSLDVAEDTFSCIVTALAIGSASVTVTDPGPGITSEPEVITVTAGPASAITITAGEPVSPSS